jgi:hypothetical protein
MYIQRTWVSVHGGIASFYLLAPQNPGIYEVQCKFEQESSPVDAIDSGK